MKSGHSMPFGAEVTEHGVRFSIWAPAARYAYLHIGERRWPMESREGGFFTRVVADASAGTRYSFSFDSSNLCVPDPASRFNPDDVHAPSEVIDPKAYTWSDDGWHGRPWAQAVIYELHIGTFTAAGTYAAAAERLDYLADLGVTAVELMPLADTPGRWNWGYDGALLFAPQHGYGRPDDLKRFVEAAHRRNLMVLLDVVYNHFGPEGNYLHLYAPQFFTDRHHTPWGNAVNLDSEGSDVVRRFFVDNARYWLEEYHFDGLRLDAVHSLRDDSSPDFLTELATAVRALATPPFKHLVLENDDNAARYLVRDPAGAPLAYDAQWNDDFHHALLVVLTGEATGHYQDYDRPTEQLLRCLLRGFAFQGEHSRFRERPRGEPTDGLPTTAFVNFLQNHDQIGNRPDGKRIAMLLDAEALHAAETLLLLLPTPILLFMGEEFHAPNAFPFFCDFSGDLATAIREGRRRDFAALGAGDAIADPNDPSVRSSAVLDWGALELDEHRLALARYRALLELRREYLERRLPARDASGELVGERALTVRWRLADGARLALLANLAPHEQSCGASSNGKLLASSHADAASRPPRTLPPWFVAWFMES